MKFKVESESAPKTQISPVFNFKPIQHSGGTKGEQTGEPKPIDPCPHQSCSNSSIAALLLFEHQKGFGAKMSHVHLAGEKLGEQIYT